jgi:16S rRNA (guanine966-N2)-methyltransferase
MRIISGDYKGKKIFLPKNKYTRPLRDLVKESIFNLLMHSREFKCYIEDANVLDLFSGVGSFGLECISRKSKNVIFMENSPDALEVLKKNLKSLNIYNNFEILENDCFNYFNKNLNFKKEFDIIFIDPPYKEKRTNFLINSVLEKKILKKDGVMIIHKHKKDYNIEISKLNIIEQRNYGISKIIIGN